MKKFSIFMLISTLMMSYGSFSSDKQEYIKKTQKIFENSVYPYFQQEKKIELYLNQKYTDNSDMHSVWNAVQALEGLPNGEVRYQQGLDYYTDEISATVGGTQTYNNELKAFFGAAYGINLNKNAMMNDLDVLIPSAIHTGLNDKNYAYANTGLGIRHQEKNTVNNIQFDNPSLQNHRGTFFSILMLSVFLEQELNLVIHKKKTNMEGKPIRQIIGKNWPNNSPFQKAWTNAVHDVASMYAVQLAMFPNESYPGEQVQEFLNGIKDQFLTYFIPIANLTNDRKHGIVRQSFSQEEDVQPQIKTAVLLPQNIKIGEKLQEENVTLKITSGGLGQIVFINKGGPSVYQKQLRNNNKISSVIIPFRTADMQKGQLIGGTNYSLLLGNKDLNEKEAQRLENLYGSNKMFIISTQTPEVDGIFAYIPQGVDKNTAPEFRMIAKPMGNFNDSIAKKNPQKLAFIAQAIAKGTLK